MTSRRRVHRPTRLALGCLVILVTLPALAVAAGPSLSAIERQLERRLPGVELELEERLSIGRLKLRLAKVVVGAAGDPEARDVLRGVRRVEIADYRVRSLPVLDTVGVLELVDGDGWARLIHSREDDELMWVYAREEKTRLTGLLVVDLGDSWLSVVSIEGKIGEWLERMAADEPGGIRDLF